MFSSRASVLFLSLALLATSVAAGKPPKLLTAVKVGDTALVAKLIKKGVDLEATDRFGARALPAAAGRERVEIVRMLLDAGADVNAPGDIGMTALMSAAIRGNRELVDLLLEAGADVNARDWEGESALQWLTTVVKKTPEIEQKHLALAELLIERGAEVDLPNDLGESALHVSARRDRPSFAALMLRHGADPSFADKYGRTPLDYALEHEQQEIVGLLRAHDATEGEVVPIEAKDCPEGWGELWVGMSHEQFKAATGLELGIGNLDTSVMADDAVGRIVALGKTVSVDRNRRIVGVVCH